MGKKKSIYCQKWHAEAEARIRAAQKKWPAPNSGSANPFVTEKPRRIPIPTQDDLRRNTPGLKNVHRAYVAQLGLCFYCWVRMDEDYTAEHLQSKSEGGRLNMSNTKACHQKCNGLVSNFPVAVKLWAREEGRMRGLRGVRYVVTRAHEYRKDGIYGPPEKS